MVVALFAVLVALFPAAMAVAQSEILCGASHNEALI
jgi:hypothetical protein